MLIGKRLTFKIILSTGLWCWIVRDATGYRFGTWYVPIFLLLVAMVTVYVYIIITVLRQDGGFTGFYKTDESAETRQLAKEVNYGFSFFGWLT